MKQRVSELERTLSTVSTQQKQFERVTYFNEFVMKQMNKVVTSKNEINFHLTYACQTEISLVECIWNIAVMLSISNACLFVFFSFYFQQNKELEKERDNLRLEVLRLK